MIEDREYQGRAVDGVGHKFRAGYARVLLVSSTGSGKTTMACRVTQRTVANGKRVLFLAHRRRLIQQIAERSAEFGVRYGVEMADLPDAPWARKDPTAPLQIASRDTLLSRAARNGFPSADLLIIDEAHNLEGAAYEALANGCGIKYRVGLTATPCMADGSGLGARNWDTIVEAATVRELIALKKLVPIKTFAPPEVGARRKRGEKVGIAGDPVDHWKRYGEDRPTIVFTAKVTEAVAVRDLYRAAGISAEYVDAKTPYAERERIVDGLRSGRIRVVCNVNIWTEGVDIPELTVCQLLCKCGSLIRFLQAVGRIMRTSPGKEYGILLDHAGAVFEHGFPDEPADWALSEDDDISKRHDKEREEGTRAAPSLCRNCGCMFAGQPTCPECHTPTPRGERKAGDYADDQERLVQVGGSEAPEDANTKRQRMQRHWISLLHQCGFAGQKIKAASVRFKTKFGVWPEAAGVDPLPGRGTGDQFVKDVFPQFSPRKK